VSVAYYNCVIKKTETELLPRQGISFQAYKMYNIAIFTQLVAKLYRHKTLRCSFKATADGAVQGKIYSICSMPELSERNFCDGLEMKFTSPLGGI